LTVAVAFYCVCDSSYFLGAVAMLNSLRLVGHTEPAFILDCGLTDRERELLSSQATLVAAPDGVPPWLLKAAAPHRHPAHVMVLIDADIIVARHLGSLTEDAARGRVVAFENRSDRFFAEWGDLLDLGTARQRQYVSSSLVCLGGALGSEVVGLIEELRDRVDFSRSWWRANAPDYPFLYADQDILNAILATRVDPARVTAVDERMEAVTPYAGLRIADEATLRCVYEDGLEPLAVHHFLPLKPWLEPAIPGVYTRLLERLLRGDDVAIRVPEGRLPPHLRPGLIGAARSWRRGGLSARLRALRDRIGATGRDAES
jgi:hypothetical protein